MISYIFSHVVIQTCCNRRPTISHSKYNELLTSKLAECCKWLSCILLSVNLQLDYMKDYNITKSMVSDLKVFISSKEKELESEI